VKLLDAPAQLPLGPYLLAATREVPVFCTFVMKETTNTYHVFVRLLEINAEETTTVRQRAAALAQAFADNLSEIVRRYPHQWLNYYEFWQHE
jgi:predicted LPLAT superfamily acyltransferase